MGRLFIEFLHPQNGTKFVCRSCGCDVASESTLVWEGFMNVSTPAFLFNSSVNLSAVGTPRQEELSTGKYTLEDVGCRSCCSVVGWRYVWAERQEQAYKQGCVLLDQSNLHRVGCKVLPMASLPTSSAAVDDSPSPQAVGC